MYRGGGGGGLHSIMPTTLPMVLMSTAELHALVHEIEKICYITV